MVKIKKKIETREKLKELRENRKLTLEQISNFLEIDQKLLYDIEEGFTEPTMHIIHQLSMLYGCPEEYLLNVNEDYENISFAMRSHEIDDVDLKAIAMINKIILNTQFLNKIENEENQ